MFLRPCRLATWTDTHFTRHFLRLSVIRNRTTQSNKKTNQFLTIAFLPQLLTYLWILTQMRGSRFSPEFSSPVLDTEHRMAIDAITASTNVKDAEKNRVWLNAAKDRKGPQRTHKEPQRSFNPKEHITQDHRGSAIMRKLPDLQQFCLIFKNYFVYFL